VVLSDGGFQLIQHGQASCRPLDIEAMDEIVEAVDRWYDAFFARAVRESPARMRNKSPARSVFRLSSKPRLRRPASPT
jgi:hypothetical protein